MPKYLISFPAEAMRLSPAEVEQAGKDAHAVIAAAKAAGVHVFAGGIDAAAGPLRVHADGHVEPGGYPGRLLDGGFAVLDLPGPAEAKDWARRLAAACRCAQEVRVFGEDPES